MAQITDYLKKLFGFRKVNMKLMAHYLVKCAKSESYIETLGDHADSLHNWIKSSYDIDFKRAFENQVRNTIKKLRITKAELAIDITKEPFYGKTRSLHIFNTDKSKPYGGEFWFISCCLINKDKQIPIMALPVRHGEQVRLTIELIDYCRHLFKYITKVLFDRGFYCAELINYLEAYKINYLMLVPKRPGILAEFLENTLRFDILKHKMSYLKDKSKWSTMTNIVACKEIFGYNWLFATNIRFQKPEDYVCCYKRRWQIETNYRIEDESRIKSKSSNYMIRYFYFLISSLLHMLWIIHKKFYFYVPFKKYLDIIEKKLLFEYLGVPKIF